MKRSFLLSLWFLGSLTISSFSQPVTMSLPSNFQATALTQVQIPVTVMNFDTVCNVSMAFKWDTTVLVYQGYSQNITATMGGLFAANHIGNQFRLGWFGLNPASLPDSAWIVNVNFTYLGGTAALTWDMTPDNCVIGDCNAGVKPSGWVNGNVVPQLPFGMIEGNLKYDNSSQSAMPQVMAVLKDNSGIPVDTTLTDSLGHYSFQVTNTGIYTLNFIPSMPWNSVNGNDALTIVRHFVGFATLTGLGLTAADVDNNNHVNSSDALIVMKRFVGMQNYFPSGDWAFDAPAVPMPYFSNLTVNVKALLFGDTDHSYIP